MLTTIAPHLLELLLVAERDARAVLGFDEEAEKLAEAIAARYGMPLVALTRPPGSEPGDLLLARNTVHYAPRYPVEIVDRIGAGDSFLAGLVHGLLAGDLDQVAVRLAAAYAAAVSLATPGDINFFAPEDLTAFQAGLTGALVPLTGSSLSWFFAPRPEPDLPGRRAAKKPNSRHIANIGRFSCKTTPTSSPIPWRRAISISRVISR